MKRLIKALGICFLLAALTFGGSLIADRQRLSQDLIRLHVVANSDSEEDQELKLRVRNAVTECLGKALNQVQDVETAKAYLQDNLPKLQTLCNQVLEKAGSAQKAVVTLCREGFPAREYDTFSLPAGLYESLRIVIGEGEGHNWWCVVFPGLCAPETQEDFTDTAAVAGFPRSLTGALSGEKKYEIRFFLLDKLGQLEKRLAGISE